MNKEDTYIIK